MNALETIKRNFGEQYPDFVDYAEKLTKGEITAVDKIYYSYEFGYGRVSYGYFKVENGRITAIGEECLREGGWFWLERHHKECDL